MFRTISATPPSTNTSRAPATPRSSAIGITDYAQGELGDVVFVNLPKPGDKLDGHQSFGTIEAVKAVSELYSPVAGEVVEVNAALDERSGGRQPRSLRRGLDDRASGDESGRSRRAALARRLPEPHRGVTVAVRPVVRWIRLANTV